MSIARWSLVAIAVLTGACASTGVDRTDTLVDSFTQVAAASAVARTRIDEVSSELTGIVGGGDARAMLERFHGGIGNVTGARSDLDSNAAAVRRDIAEHFAAWQKDADAMKNAEIREVSIKRRENVHARADELEPVLAKASTAFDAYLANLHDVETLLATDLSKDGLSAASGTVKQSTKEGEQVKRALGELETKVAEIRQMLAVRGESAAVATR